MFNITNFQGNRNENHSEILSQTCYNGEHQEDKRYVGKNEKKRKHLCTVGGNGNWCRHNGNQHTGPSKNLKIESLYNPTMWLLRIHAGKIKQGYHKISVLLCLWQHYSQGPRYETTWYPSTDEWRWGGHECACVLEYYSAMGKKVILSLATMCMKLGATMHSEISQSEKDRYCVRSLTCGI